jgi:hypothetical protein
MSDLLVLISQCNILSRVEGYATNITGPGLDDWIYWCMFTNYTSNYNHLSQARFISFLDYERLPYHCGWLVLLQYEYNPLSYEFRLTNLNSESVGVRAMLRPTVSRSVCLGIKHPSGAYEQIFITARQVRVC